MTEVIEHTCIQLIITIKHINNFTLSVIIALCCLHLSYFSMFICSLKYIHFYSEKIKYYPKRVTSFYHFYQDIFQEFFVREFLGVLVVGILDFYCCDPVSVPSWVTEILQAVWHREKKKSFLLETHRKIL